LLLFHFSLLEPGSVLGIAEVPCRANRATRGNNDLENRQKFPELYRDDCRLIFERKSIMNAAVLFLVTLLAATPVEPSARWQGMIADESLKILAPDEGFLADAKSLEKVWKEWRPQEEIPAVDFSKEIILVGVVDGPNRAGIQPSLDEKGDLHFIVVGTKVGGPGFGYLLLKVSREGVKTVNLKPLKAQAADDGKDARVAASGTDKLAVLEQKLVGAWIGHGGCVGNWVIQSDGTYHHADYGPGAGAFETGKWKIDWSELPPTLVLTGYPSGFYVVRLNDKHLHLRWTGDGDARIEEHERGTEMDDASIRIGILDSAVARFRRNEKYGAGKTFPPDLKTLVDIGILRAESLLDPWGKEFKYDISGKRNKPDIWTETPGKKIIGNWPDVDN
jgi:hypothetical protein